MYHFPHLAVGEGWQTTITYINYSPQEVTCQTEFLSDQGSPLLVLFAGRGMDITRTDVLPPGGSVHEETNVELSAPLAPGWARATCSGPLKASLLFRRYDSEGVPVAEAGVNAARVPATRFVTFAEQGEGRFGTGVAYANPSATSALVTFTARDADGQMLASVDGTLLPGGHDAQNMVGLFGLPSFTGSLEITSTEPIVHSVAELRSRSGVLLPASGGTGCCRAVIGHLKPGSGAGGHRSRREPRGYSLTMFESGAMSFELGVDAHRRVNPAQAGAEHGVGGRFMARW